MGGGINLTTAQKTLEGRGSVIPKVSEHVLKTKISQRIRLFIVEL